MTLQNQLKGVKMSNGETIHSYFSKVSQIKEQLEAVDEMVENGEIVMTTLNGLPRSWDSFIQGICARKKLISFNKLWEECSQEGARLVAREEKMGNEDQALTAHTKGSKFKRERSHNKKHSHPHHKNKDLSNVQCFECNEKGHFASDCPNRKKDNNFNNKKKKNNRRYHAHVADDDEPP